METIDLPYAPYCIVATTLTLWLATGCGPTMKPSAEPEGLPAARETAEAAAQAVRTAESEGERIVLYASSEAGRQTGPPSGDPDEGQPGDREHSPDAPGSPETPDSPRDEQKEDGEATDPEGTDARLRRVVVERGDDRVTVLHAPYNKDGAVAAFQKALETLRASETLPEEPGARPGADEQPADGEKPSEGDRSKTPYASWSRDWSPDRLELDELALVDNNTVEITGTAAAKKDVDEFVTRLNSLDAFSEIAIDSTGSVDKGQGITFRVAGSYEAGDSQN